jgi:hypothetical protein
MVSVKLALLKCFSTSGSPSFIVAAVVVSLCHALSRAFRNNG